MREPISASGISLWWMSAPQYSYRLGFDGACQHMANGIMMGRSSTAACIYIGMQCLPHLSIAHLGAGASIVRTNAQTPVLRRIGATSQRCHGMELARCHCTHCSPRPVATRWPLRCTAFEVKQAENVGPFHRSVVLTAARYAPHHPRETLLVAPAWWA
jgi:hypothetical protein